MSVTFLLSSNSRVTRPPCEVFASVSRTNDLTSYVFSLPSSVRLTVYSYPTIRMGAGGPCSKRLAPVLYRCQPSLELGGIAMSVTLSSSSTRSTTASPLDDFANLR